MQIIITNAANIRSKPFLKAPVVSYAYVGQIYDSAGLKTGDNVWGNSNWHELTVGGYLWSGNAKKYEKRPLSHIHRLIGDGHGSFWDLVVGDRQ